ncbi:MAG: class I SAM-dependent methyltransferase [Cytophagaceae bacterium]|nr:class I SAM-dependent methyltransferase [Gemmatimonadaceae bacterium]
MSLLAPARDQLGGAGPWVDLGCGAGTFTRALAELIPAGCEIEAVDRDASALRRIPREHHGIAITTRQLDLERGPLPWTARRGVLMANALHYVSTAADFLATVRACLRPGGHMLVVEYDTDEPHPPWVPFPVSLSTLERLAIGAGFISCVPLGDRSSRYGGRVMYGALLGTAGGAAPA